MRRHSGAYAEDVPDEFATSVFRELSKIGDDEEDVFDGKKWRNLIAWPRTLPLWARLGRLDKEEEGLRCNLPTTD